MGSVRVQALFFALGFLKLAMRKRHTPAVTRRVQGHGGGLWSEDRAYVHLPSQILYVASYLLGREHLVHQNQAANDFCHRTRAHATVGDARVVTALAGIA
jgi:hypothetical protein